MHIHHKDNNSANNSLDNLEVITPSEHSSITSKENINNGVNKYEHLKHYRSTPKYGKDNHLYIHKTKYQLLRMLFEAGGNLTRVNMDFNTFKGKCIEEGINLKEVKNRFSRKGHYISKATFKKHLLTNPDDIKNSLLISTSQYDFLLEKFNYTNHKIIGVNSY